MSLRWETGNAREGGEAQRAGRAAGSMAASRGLQVKDGRLKSPEELDHYRAGKMR